MVRLKGCTYEVWGLGADLRSWTDGGRQRMRRSIFWLEREIAALYADFDPPCDELVSAVPSRFLPKARKKLTPHLNDGAVNWGLNEVTKGSMY